MHPFVLCSSHCLVSSLLSIAHGWVVCATKIPLDLQIVTAIWDKWPFKTHLPCCNVLVLHLDCSAPYSNGLSNASIWGPGGSWSSTYGAHGCNASTILPTHEWQPCYARQLPLSRKRWLQVRESIPIWCLIGWSPCLSLSWTFVSM